jgi:hypothetical protein
MLTVEILEQKSQNLALGLVFSYIPEGWGYYGVICHIYDTKHEDVPQHEDLVPCELYQYHEAEGLIDELETLQRCIYAQFKQFCVE